MELTFLCALKSLPMDWWLLPFCTAMSTWIAFRVLQYFLFKSFSWRAGSSTTHNAVLPRLEKFINRFTEQIVQAVTTDKRLSQYLTAPSTLQPMMPFIETHIDDFLRHKLGKAMPVVSMFVGDKTINQMKGVFMNELESLLPALINRFLEESLQTEKLRPLIRNELIQLTSHPAFVDLKDQLKIQLSKLSWVATAIAFLTGLILSGILYGFNII